MVNVGIYTTWMSQEVSKWLVNGFFHLLINGVYWGYNPLILTIDPNFLGHPPNVMEWILWEIEL